MILGNMLKIIYGMVPSGIDGMIKELTISTEIGCGILCQRNEKCGIVTYHTERKTCQLYGRKITYSQNQDPNSHVRIKGKNKINLRI